ncbi:hypothetical protein [Pedobacter gandavensis]|uniref:hypothetical protein n=1 Tax=Pedobacter gandavensis TaxID=2679963 RepID=UPI00292D68DE|nr:hypothetical protein [Pedobacter gandavensis]
MSIYQGNAEGFLRYVGPLTRNIVCNLSRSLKKGTSCQGILAAGTRCKKRTRLEAAHIKGQERPVIIATILEQFNVKDDEYKVDLREFETAFRKAHQNLDEVIKVMCKSCHTRYDNEHQITQGYPIVLEDEYGEEELVKLEKQEVKEVEKNINSNQRYKTQVLIKVQSKHPQIHNKNMSYSRISDANGLWNFDVNKKKFEDDFYFVFYDQQTLKTKVAKIPACTLNLVNNSTKVDAVRFYVKWEDGKLMERTIGDLSEFII